jgi:hypothetical protein
VKVDSAERHFGLEVILGLVRPSIGAMRMQRSVTPLGLE